MQLTHMSSTRHHAPPALSENSVVRKHGFLGDDGPHRKPPGAPEYPTTRLVLGLPVSDPVSAYPAPGQAQVALLLTGQIKSPGTIGSGRTRIRSRAMATIAPDSRSFATVVRATQQIWACACKRPRAGGNIGGRRHADIATQDFDLCGWWRLLRFGERGGGSARREKLFGRDAETCGFGTMTSLQEARFGSCPATIPRARANGARSRISTARSAAMPVTRSSCR